MQEETELKEFVAQKVQIKEAASADDVWRPTEEDTLRFAAKTRLPRSDSSSSTVQNVPEEAAVVKLQAIAAELVPKESFILRRQDPLQSTGDSNDGASMEDIADEPGMQFSDEFCRRVSTEMCAVTALTPVV